MGRCMARHTKVSHSFITIFIGSNLGGAGAGAEAEAGAGAGAELMYQSRKIFDDNSPFELPSRSQIETNNDVANTIVADP
jgi:hypothetical protein